MKYDKRIAGMLAIVFALLMIILGMRAFASTREVMNQQAEAILQHK